MNYLVINGLFMLILPLILILETHIVFTKWLAHGRRLNRSNLRAESPGCFIQGRISRMFTSALTFTLTFTLTFGQLANDDRAIN